MCSRAEDVIILGFLPHCRSSRRLDLLWWVISNSATAGDLLVALIVFPCYSASDTPLSAAGEKNEDLDSASLQRWAVGKRRKRIFRQLKELSRLCKQHRIEMNVRFVGGECPERVLVEQAKNFRASVLVISTSEGFVSWRRWKRKRSNYLLQHIPLNCSVVIVRNSRIFQCQKDQQDEPEDEKEDTESCPEENVTLDTNQNDTEVKSETGEEELLNQYQKAGSSLPEIAQVCFSLDQTEVECKVIVKQETEDSLAFPRKAKGSASEATHTVFEQSRNSSVPETSQAHFDINKGTPKEDMTILIQDAEDPSSPEIIQVYFNIQEDSEEFQRFTEQEIKGFLQQNQQSKAQTIEDSSDTRQTEPKNLKGGYVIEVNHLAGDCKKQWHEETLSRSPRSVLEARGSATDSEGNSPPATTGEFLNKPTQTPYPHHAENSEDIDNGFRWRNLLGKWKQSSIRRTTTFPPANTSRVSATISDKKISHKRSNSCHQSANSPSTRLWSLEKSLSVSFTKPSWKCFTLEELKLATNNFSPENLVGKGGHAEVFKGVLAGGEVAAIKRLNGSEEQRTGDFLTELGIIAHINHPNVAHLVGFSIEGGLHIVLKFFARGSLESMLHGPNSKVLNWDTRYRVAVGIAKGLHYLHEGCQRRIIHRDIKSSNILLTDDFEPQIADFGLAKWLPKQCPQLYLTPIEGTFGYLAPEYFMHGIVDEKTDVFAFGVLLLELITGHPPIDSSQNSLVMWARPLITSKNIKELADPSFETVCDAEQMNRLALTAGLCIQHNAHNRPSMAQVMELITGEKELLEFDDYLGKQNACLEALDKEDYTFTTYLRDLNRHKEVALEN